MAHRVKVFIPQIVPISISASISSLELNTGNLWVSTLSRMIPAAQTSMAATGGFELRPS